jgi:hypothetical protein
MSAKKKSAVKKAPGFKYKPRFGLIIELENEPHQAAVYKQLKKLGFEPRVVNV